jgi:hypothetical protein
VIRAAIVIFAALIVAAPSLAQSPRTAECLLFGFCRGDDPPQVEPDPRGTADKPLVEQVQRSEDEKREAKEKADTDHEIAAQTKSLAIATYILGIATAFVALLTFLLWRGAERKSYLESRAYVGFVAASADPRGQRYLLVDALYKNTGRTPALDVGHTFSVELLDVDPAQATFDSADAQPGMWTMVPIAEGRAYKTIPFSASDDQACRDVGTTKATKAVYAWGTVTYRDIYGGSGLVRYRYRMRANAQGNWELRPEPTGHTTTYTDPPSWWRRFW